MLCDVHVHWTHRNRSESHPPQHFRTPPATLIRERIHWDQHTTFIVPEIEGGSCTLTALEQLDDDDPDAVADVGRCTVPLSSFEAADAPQEWHRIHPPAAGPDAAASGSILVQGLLTPGPGMGRRGAPGMCSVAALLVPLAFDADTRIRREAVTVLSQHVEPGCLPFMKLLVRCRRRLRTSAHG